MTQQYTPAQLEAWAGLGPWRWQETRTNFETETALVHKDAGIVLNASWRPSSCEIQVSDPDSEALIAAAPDLARLVLEKEKEIARLRLGFRYLIEHVESIESPWDVMALHQAKKVLYGSTVKDDLTVQSEDQPHD